MKNEELFLKEMNWLLNISPCWYWIYKWEFGINLFTGDLHVL